MVLTMADPKRRPGRPEIGGRVTIALGPLLARIDAARGRTSRASWLRSAAEHALTCPDPCPHRQARRRGDPVTTTRTNPITAEVIREAIDSIDAIVRAELYPSYQGRGMTKPCVGVVIPDARDLLALGASIAYVIASRAETDEDDQGPAGQQDALNAIDDAIDPIRRARIDSLGVDLGVDLIVYWPAVPAEETTR